MTGLANRVLFNDRTDQAIRRVGRTRLIAAARDNGSIPDGPPVQLVAAAFTGVLEAIGIELAGRPPHDVELMSRGVRGVLGVAPVVPQ